MRGVRKTDTIKRCLRRIKRGKTPLEPPSIADIPELPEEYTSTGGADDLPYLLYDNRSIDQSDNSVLVFGTETCVAVTDGTLMGYLVLHQGSSNSRLLLGLQLITCMCHLYICISSQQTPVYI